MHRVFPCKSSEQGLRCGYWITAKFFCYKNRGFTTREISEFHAETAGTAKVFGRLTAPRFSSSFSTRRRQQHGQASIASESVRWPFAEAAKWLKSVLRAYRKRKPAPMASGRAWATGGVGRASRQGNGTRYVNTWQQRLTGQGRFLAARHGLR
jgi:hypothetical protein